MPCGVSREEAMFYEQQAREHDEQANNLERYGLVKDNEEVAKLAITEMADVIKTYGDMNNLEDWVQKWIKDHT